MTAILALLPIAGSGLARNSAFSSGDAETMIDNLLANLPDASTDEIFETLLEQPGIRLERIISQGQVTPPGEWYDQEQDEWVMVLSGEARLLIEGEHEQDMGPGDAVFLPAHRRHRVTWTDPAQPTIWLALHIWSDRQ